VLIHKTDTADRIGTQHGRASVNFAYFRTSHCHDVKYVSVFVYMNFCKRTL